MLAKNICLALLGFSAGITAAGGLFSFIIGLGVISDFADRTHTGEQVMLYEDAVAAGGSLGAVILCIIRRFRSQAVCFRLWDCSEESCGCWAMALTEMLDLFPIFIRRIRMVRGIAAVMIGIAFGKGLGALLFFWKRW